MLRQAVYMEDRVTLEHLVKKKANLEAKDEAGSTPLHIAATRCKPQTISWLITQRADITARDGEGFSALSWACMKGHHEVLKLLIGGGADINERTETSGKSALVLTAERGHFDCMLELLVCRASIEERSVNGSTALMCAAHQGETEIVSYLLEKQSLVNMVDEGGWNALMYTVNAQAPNVSLGGEEAEKRVNIDGILGKRTTVDLMLLHGVDVNAQTSDGLSALMIAAGRDRPQAVKKLLEASAEVDMKTTHGQSALLMAASHDLPQIVRILIIAKADVNYINEKKESALSIAEKFQYKDVFDVLKSAGATSGPGKKGKKGKKK